MPGYNRRDQIGHWVTKEQPVYRPCTHACCREEPMTWQVVELAAEP